MAELKVRFKQARLDKGLTQVQLAEIVGASQTAVNKIEIGSTKKPRNIVEFAEALEVTPTWLTYGDHSELYADCDLGKKIKNIRLDLGMTQNELAKSSGVVRASINRLETGTCNRTNNLEGIARALRVTPDWLLGRKTKISNVNLFEIQFDQKMLQGLCNIHGYGNVKKALQEALVFIDELKDQAND